MANPTAARGFRRYFTLQNVGAAVVPLGFLLGYAVNDNRETERMREVHERAFETFVKNASTEELLIQKERLIQRQLRKADGGAIFVSAQPNKDKAPTDAN
eukprot:Colp12_sorted_trinity150504_noHs@28000